MKRIVFAGLALLLLAGLGFAGARPEATQAATPDYQIGIVFDVGGRGDNSFNDSAYGGLVMLAEEFDGYIADDPDRVNFGTKVELKYLEPKAGGQDREQLLRVLAEDGFDLLYGVGFAFTDALEKVAKDFPGTHFVIIDAVVDLPNVTSVTFKEHEGSFLVGALTGLFLADRSPASPIGFLGGMDIPLIHRFHSGFFAGAMYTNPVLRDANKLLGQYIGQDPTAFNDPQTAESISTTFFDRGAFVIYHASGASGSGLFKAAADKNRWAIGVDSDQGMILATSASAQERALAGRILTSMLKRVDNSVFLTASELITTGRVSPGILSFGLSDGGVGYAVNDYNRQLVAPYIDRLEELRTKVISGEIQVPDHDNQLLAWAQAIFR